MAKRIIKSETGFRGAYLSTADAAEYCGFRRPEYLDPVKSFLQAVRRSGIPKCYIGQRARFLIRDLDEHLQRLRPTA